MQEVKFTASFNEQSILNFYRFI